MFGSIDPHSMPRTVDGAITMNPLERVSANTMRASFLVAPETIETRECPAPIPTDGEVVVRVECALTCGTDLKAFRRGHPFIPMPGPFGHQYCGRIHAVGAGVEGFEPGMPILGVHSAPCRACAACQRKRYSLCDNLSEQMALGAFAQFLRVPSRVVEQNLMPRPRTISAIHGAFLEPISCIVHALSTVRWSHVDRVLVLGLGSMGQLFCQLLPRFTRGSVVAAGKNARRLALARGYDLELVIDASNEDWWEANRANTEGFDLVIECTGKPEGWSTACAVAGPGGQVLLFGGLATGISHSVDAYRLHYQELAIWGSFHFGPPDVRIAADFLRDTDLRLTDLISGTIGLEELESGLARMASGDAIKYAVDPWSPVNGTEDAAYQRAVPRDWERYAADPVGLAPSQECSRP